MKRYTVEDIGRVYVDEDDRWFCSVSTVLDHRPKPEALINWIENTENSDEINRFKRNRGTLIHYVCQNPLFKQSVNDDDADMWSDDETESKRELQSDGRWVESETDIEWAKNIFLTLNELHSVDHIIGVETYVKHIDVGYAGQFDFIYYDQKRDSVALADIKTGKGVYPKNQDQLAAYSKAVPISVDRAEIWRINPDNKDWEISVSKDIGIGTVWDRSLEDCWTAFKETYDDFEREELSAVRDEIRSLVQDNSVNAQHEQSSHSNA